VFQVLWIKQMSLIVGVDVHAVTTGVAAFFAGLALGGWALGRIADQVERPLRLYAGLEAGVALLGLATTLGLARFPALFARLETTSSLLAWSLLFLLLAPAPLLMGGSLPAVVRSLGLTPGQFGAGAGRLYAANTLGAILGAALSTFVLIPHLGLQRSAFAAAGLLLATAIAALALDQSSRQRPVPPTAGTATATENGPDPTGESLRPRVGIACYALAGGLALGYEVVWSQSIVQFMSTRAFAFSVMLVTYLAGLALGALLYARRADRVRDPWSAFGLLIGGAGLAALLGFTLLGRWLPALQAAAERWILSATDNLSAGMYARFAVAAACLVLPATLLLGAAFPAALRLVVNAGQPGRDVGRLVAWNTLGGIAGTVITGFLLVPQLGLVGSLAVLALSATALGVFASLQGRHQPGNRRHRQAALALASATLLLAILTPNQRLASLLASARGGTPVFYREGRGGVVAVLEQSAGRKAFRRLYIQGVSNTGDSLPSLRYMRLQALLPLIVHRGEPRSALVIGLGTGITAGALLAYPGLEHRVVAELLPEVVQAASLFQGNFSAPTAQGLEIRVRDGRRELLSNAQSYDLITLEPPPPSASGVVNLYSSDFYQLARTRLRPGGLVAQWLPLPTQNDEESRSLVRSFLDVFPHASLWTTELHEMLLLGSTDPLDLNFDRIRQRFLQPSVAAALAEVGVGSPEALLATWITDRRGLETYAGDARPVTDDQPRIEYAPWVRPDEIHRVLPRLIGLRSPLPLPGASPDFLRAVAAEHQRLLLFYQAALNAQTGHPELWARDLRIVRSQDDRNPYYRWFGETPP
jgi:predicted membrane-bound spermidine synthase